MTPDAELRMNVYQEGQRAAKDDLECPYTDWRAGTWKKGFDAARAHHEAQIAQIEQPAAPAAQLCMCKDRPLSECPGEWEPGCDLGNNPAFIVRSSEPAAPAVEDKKEPTLKPCRSPYCECDPGKCTHPGCYDARHEPWPPI